MFGAAFNAMFAVYVAIFTLSGLALIAGLTQIDVEDIKHRFPARTPTTWISGYMLVVAAGLSAVYVQQIMAFIFTGRLPPVVVMTGHPTSVVFALDLSLLVPGLVLGAYWLWKREPWGYVVAAIVNVKGTVYGLALIAASMWAANAGVSGASTETPLWLMLTAGNLTATVCLFARFESGERS